MSDQKPTELSLLDAAIAAMTALHDSAEPQTDHPDIPALIPASAFRTFVDAHARLLLERQQLIQGASR